MLGLFPGSAPPVQSVPATRRRNFMSWCIGYAVCIVATLTFAAIAVSTATQPFSLALLILLVGAAVCVVRPVLGLYGTVFFTIFGDPITSSWYPFFKNFSSAESILFINKQIIFSPLELYLSALMLGMVLRSMSSPEVRSRRDVLLIPILVFTGFLLFGFVNGVSHGADIKIAVTELRPVLYVAVVYVLATKLFNRRSQYLRLYGLIVLAVFGNSIVAIIWYRGVPAASKDDLESLVAHGVTLPMNAMFVFIVASWLFKCQSQYRRLVLPLLAAPVIYVYLISQRRAAFVALLGAIILIFIVLLWTNSRTFWRLAPVVLIVGALYTGAFWNSTGSLGFPAQAVKSVIAPDQLNQKDASSDAYRVAEKTDLLFTIRSSQFLGIGFGQKFYRPVPLPAITTFELAEYTPHNSVLWVWIKTGIGGFVALLFLLATAMRTGANSLRRSKRPDDSAVLFTSLAFVVMYMIFAYVDIAWDAQNTVFLGVALAAIASWNRLKDVDHVVMKEPSAALTV